MKREIDQSTWKRREHFEVFKNFDEPLFGITVRVECSAAYRKAKNLGWPFSLYYLYLSLKTANEIEEFRYRIEDEKVYCYDSVGAGPTIFRENETYGCGYFPYNKDIAAFMAQAKAETKRVKAERGLKFHTPAKTFYIIQRCHGLILQRLIMPENLIFPGAYLKLLSEKSPTTAPICGCR